MRVSIPSDPSRAFDAIRILFLRVPEWQVVNGQAGAADVPTRIDHTLGTTPLTFLPSPMRAGAVYATEADRAMWDSKSIYVRSSVANAPVQILLMA
jgi:hypothetical protein